MAAAALKLRPIEVSPTTAQYLLPTRSAKVRPSYPKRFYPNEDAQRTLQAPWLKFTDPTMPPYPYGRNQTFDEANFGLYGGKVIQSGNKISDGRNKGRTKRRWYPNVRVQKLKSEALGIEMDLPVVARVSRTIEKCGGLDQYLLGEKPARLKELGLLGWKLRWLVAKSQVTQTRWAEQRKQLGLEDKDVTQETFADAWKDPRVRQQLIEKMSVGWEQVKQKDTTFKKHVKKVMHWKGRIGAGRNGILRMFDPANVNHLNNLHLPEEVEESESKLKVPKIPKSKNVIDVAAKVSSESAAAQLQAILNSAPKEVVEEIMNETKQEKPLDV